MCWFVQFCVTKIFAGIHSAWATAATRIIDNKKKMNDNNAETRSKHSNEQSNFVNHVKVKNMKTKRRKNCDKEKFLN